MKHLPSLILRIFWTVSHWLFFKKIIKCTDINILLHWGCSAQHSKKLKTWSTYTCFFIIPQEMPILILDLVKVKGQHLQQLFYFPNVSNLYRKLLTLKKLFTRDLSGYHNILNVCLIFILKINWWFKHITILLFACRLLLNSYRNRSRNYFDRVFSVDEIRSLISLLRSSNN